MNPSGTKKAVITLSILLVLGALLCYGVFYFIKRKITQTQVYEAQLTESSQYEERDRALEKLLGDVKPEIEKLHTRAVATDGTVQFIETVESLARGQGLKVTVQGLKVEEHPTQKERFENLRVDLVVEGSWAAVYKMQSILEAMPYKLTLPSVSLQKSGESSGWQGKFTLVVLKHK